MAGTRKVIARWRLVYRVALSAAVFACAVLLLTCVATVRVSRREPRAITLTAASVVYSDTGYVGTPMDNFGRVQGRSTFIWNSPQLRLLPFCVWSTQRRLVMPIQTREVSIPLWPLPVACGIFAWYANTRIKRQREHACTTCGYDTRGLAAGACCPECGTTCTV